MKKILLLFFGLYSFLGISQSVLPPVLPDIWLQSETIESKRGYWLDATNSRRKALPDVDMHFPGSEWFNFNQSLSLDSINNSLVIYDPVKNLRSLTVIVVYHTTDTSEQGIWQFSDKKEVRAFLSTQRLSSGKAIRHTDSSITIPAIHTYIPSFRKPLQDTCKFVIGSLDSLSFKGKIAEFLVYNRFLQKTELQKVQTYLAIKYGVSLIKTNYISSQGKVLWDTLTDGGYWNSIAGIGRDVFFGLDQKQSFSTTCQDVITMGAGGVRINNQANFTELTDGNFWMWGNNGKDFRIGTEQTSTGGVLAERRWKMRCSGNTYTGVPMVLRVDISQLPEQDPKACHLVIDRGGTGNMETAEHIVADSTGVKGMLCFSNIYWDTDGSGSDVFALSFHEPVLIDSVPNQNKKSVSTNDSKGDDPEDDIEGNNASDDAQLGDSSLPNDKKITSVVDENEDIKYILSPNPTRGAFHLQISFPEETAVMIRVSNAQGKIIKERKWEGLTDYLFEDEIKLSGTYLIEVISKYEAKTLKLVVNK